VLDYAPDQKFKIRGRQLSRPFDAIIGSKVARDNAWDIGSTFKLVHGGADSDHVHDEEFTVCAVLAPTGTPNDKTVFIHLDGFYQIAGHEKPIEEAVKRWKDFNGEKATPEEIAAEAERLKKKYHLDEGHDHGHDHAHHDHGVPDEQKEVTSILL